MSGPVSDLRTALPPARGRDARGAYDYTELLGRLGDARIGITHLEDLLDANRERLLGSLSEADVDALAEYCVRCAHVTPAWKAAP